MSGPDGTDLDTRLLRAYLRTSGRPAVLVRCADTCRADDVPTDELVDGLELSWTAADPNEGVPLDDGDVPADLEVVLPGCVAAAGVAALLECLPELASMTVAPCERGLGFAGGVSAGPGGRGVPERRSGRGGLRPRRPARYRHRKRPLSRAGLETPADAGSGPGISTRGLQRGIPMLCRGRRPRRLDGPDRRGIPGRRDALDAQSGPGGRTLEGISRPSPRPATKARPGSTRTRTGAKSWSSFRNREWPWPGPARTLKRRGRSGSSPARPIPSPPTGWASATSTATAARMSCVPRAGGKAPKNRSQVPWKFHAAKLGDEAPAQMLVVDVNGDGRADVISSAAHRYGLWWYEQTAAGWIPHLIDRAVSQLHALHRPTSTATACRTSSRASGSGPTGKATKASTIRRCSAGTK